jgi:hypothetical protein
MPTSQPSNRHVSTRALATIALGAIALFPLLVVALNLVQAADGYHTGRQAVSELALGRGGALMALAFCSLGAGTILAGVLIRRTTEHGAVRSGLLGLAGLLSFVSAAFHTDATGASTTLHGRIHTVAGIITFALMVAAMLIGAFRFRREPIWQGFAGTTAVLAVAGVVAFFLVPTLGTAHFGIAQRLLIGSFLAWTLAATFYVRHATRHGEPTKTLEFSPVGAAAVTQASESNRW